MGLCVSCDWCDRSSGKRQRISSCVRSVPGIIKICICMRTLLIRASSFLVLTPATVVHAQSSSEIDPLLGADKGGNVFVGPTLPFGMAKPGPDYGDNEGNQGGKASGTRNGFTELHVSGT